MPGGRWDEEDDYRDDPRPRRGVNPALLALAVFAGLVVLGTALVCGSLLMWKPRVAPPAGPAGPAGRPATAPGPAPPAPEPGPAPREVGPAR